MGMPFAGMTILMVHVARIVYCSNCRRCHLLVDHSNDSTCFSTFSLPKETLEFALSDGCAPQHS